MLKITTIESTEGAVKLQIEGRISGEGVKLLQKTCNAHLEKGLQLSVDLQDVSFVDRGGVAMLLKLTQYKIAFLNAPLFIAEQIRKPNS